MEAGTHSNSKNNNQIRFQHRRTQVQDLSEITVMKHILVMGHKDLTMYDSNVRVELAIQN